MRNAILSALILAAGLHAQPAGALTFEVATVKPAEPPEPGKRMMMGISGGPGFADPGQISANVTLSMLLMTAYDVRPYQIKNGEPELTAPGLFMRMTVGPTGPSAHLVGKAQTTAQLADMVGNELDRPVIDKTGLTGKYDFVLEFAPDPSRIRLPPGGALPPGPPPGPGGDAPNSVDPSGLTIVGALQQQLGLRLVSTKAPLDTIVIDHAEKVPTEN
jgi:hypothetical protein